MSALRFAKGHGTENDFVLLPDVDGALPLDTRLVRALCDRRRGIGADGVLRVVRCAAEPAAAAWSGEAEWFMDYRNADGTLAEMCGNGLRVFARWLVRAALAPEGTWPVATRAGVRAVTVTAHGDVTVDMGVPTLLEVGQVVGGRAATAVDMGNPHVVVPLDEVGELDELDLDVAPAVTPGLPDGQNVEFVAATGERALRLRVHERGVGETRSCGTGVCAAVVAAVAARGAGRDETWVVQVPGGALGVCWRSTGPVLLSGPAEIVAEGEVDAEWLRTLS